MTYLYIYMVVVCEYVYIGYESPHLASRYRYPPIFRNHNEKPHAHRHALCVVSRRRSYISSLNFTRCLDDYHRLAQLNAQ